MSYLDSLHFFVNTLRDINCHLRPEPDIVVEQRWRLFIEVSGKQLAVQNLVPNPLSLFQEVNGTVIEDTRWFRNWALYRLQTTWETEQMTTIMNAAESMVRRSWQEPDNVRQIGYSSVHDTTAFY